MTTAATKKCGKCGHENLASAKFCNNCATAFPETRAAPVHVAEIKAKAAVATAHGADHATTHHSDKFYAVIFLVLGVITIIEVGLTNVHVAPVKYGSLIVLSAAKFALVIMFFMHLKGDKRMFSLLFVGPLFLGAVMLLSLAALFSKFNP